MTAPRRRIAGGDVPVRTSTLVAAIVFALFVLLSALTPTAWATPGQDVSGQTIPTRTPDRRTSQPRDTQTPVATATGTPAVSATAVLGSPIPTEVSLASPPATTEAPAPDATALPSQATVVLTSTPPPPSAPQASRTQTAALTPTVPVPSSPSRPETPAVTPVSAPTEAGDATPPRAAWALWALLGGVVLVVAGSYFVLTGRRSG